MKFADRGFMFPETPFRTRQVSYLMGAVSVMKTDIKGGRLPHSIREKGGELRQAFPYIYKRCKFAGYELELKYKQKTSSKFKEY